MANDKSLVTRMCSSLLASLVTLGQLACGGAGSPEPSSQEAGAPPPEATSASTWAHLESFDGLSHGLLDAGYAVGVVVAVVDGDESAFRGYGASFFRGTDLPGPDTVFEIGSITKPFTALLLAAMAREGLVSLEATVGQWLPEPVPAAERISLLELATHTSGLPRLPTNFAPADRDNPYAGYDWAATLAFLLEFEPAPDPAWDYSNFGYGLLGELLARSQGADYETLLTAQVLEPLGLTDTRITLSDPQRQRVAQGHGLTRRPLPYWETGALAGCFALHSTARDLLAFVRANLTTASGPLASAMSDTRIPRADTALEGWRVGLAWFVSPDGRFVWHDGGTGGFYAFVGLDTARQFGFVWLSNSSLWRITALSDRLRAILQGEPVEPLVLQPAIDVPPQVLADYVGHYTSPALQGVVFAVGLDEGMLTFGVAGMEGSSVLLAQTKSRFHLLEADSVTFSFDRDDRGRVAAMIIARGEESSTVPRIGHAGEEAER
jgi:serine-type D-Ala-D-Ala carboxypeptidase/endopeptidase